MVADWDRYQSLTGNAGLVAVVDRWRCWATIQQTSENIFVRLNRALAADEAILFRQVTGVRERPVEGSVKMGQPIIHVVQVLTVVPLVGGTARPGRRSWFGFCSVANRPKFESFTVEFWHSTSGYRQLLTPPMSRSELPRRGGQSCLGGYPSGN